MSDLQRNIFLSTLSTSGNAGVKPNGSLFARGLGRTMPFQGSAVSGPRTILSEVAQDVYSVDGCGRAFDAGQLWVRHQVASDSSGDPASFLNSYWTAIPDSVPGGFTANNKRNVFPVVHVSQQEGRQNGSSSLTLMAHGVNYNGDSASLASRPIRTADGIYLPKDNANAFAFGPVNKEQDTSGHGGGEYDYANWEIGFHAGFRSGLFVASWAAGIYMSGALLWADYIISAGPNYAGLADVYTYRINRADLVLGDDPSDATRYYKSVLLDTSASYRTTGTYSLFAVRQVTNLDPAISGNVNWNMQLAPRVDIPYPFTTSTGNLIAPGGIVTGSLPGF